MADIPEIEPQEITAGDTATWKRTDLTEDYPATTWTLKYYLCKTGKLITITAAASGNEFLVTVTAATTAAWTAGTYQWDAYVSSGAERYKVDSGIVTVLTDLATQTSGYDVRSHAKKVLDAIEAVIEGRASQDQMAYSIAGRSLQRMPVADLIVLRRTYYNEYQRELKAKKVASGDDPGGRILVRFKDPG